MRPHSPHEHEALISWLKYFDIEYLDDDLCAVLSQFDINNPTHQIEVIRIALAPKFQALNEISKASMRCILKSALTAEEDELGPVFCRIAMPFARELENRKDFLLQIWSQCISPGEA